MNKVWNIIKKIFLWVLLLVTVCMMVFTIFSVATFDRNDRSIFGYKFFIVQSDSMSATDFSAGDIILIREVDPSTLREGDIISYISQNSESFGETVTHKIRSLTTDASGNAGFITYGTTTGVDDATVVTYPYVLGRYTGRLPKLGNFFAFMKTTPGYIVCILIPFLLLIGYNGLNCISLFRRYKKEQMEELEAEREKIEEERRQSAQMLKELQELRSQLAVKEQQAEESDES